MSEKGLLPEKLKREWSLLSEAFLPVAGTGDSIWKFSRQATAADPEQGWKLHISATILTANKVLTTVGPFLKSRNVLFKGPVSLDQLSRLNSGLHYGYTQVGKCLTVYPHNDEEAMEIATTADQLTSGITAPAVPFDLKFGVGCVYYRYGAFRRLHAANESDAGGLQIFDPDGNPVPDDRKSSAAKPDWVNDPFAKEAATNTEVAPQSPFRIIRALAQRGKGGVYLAIDLSQGAPRLCILKEGRRAGETSWDGCDGYSRVKQEEQVLNSLLAGGIEVPNVYSSFEFGDNTYLATEFIEGGSLQELLTKLGRRMSVARVLRFGIQISDLISRIHSAGWVWGDCKPSNLLICDNQTLRPIDFEGACRINQPKATSWASPAFLAPEMRRTIASSNPSQDLYALGVILHHLLWGNFPSGNEGADRPKRRQKVPKNLITIICDLLCSDPHKRPGAQVVSDRLRQFESKLNSAGVSSS